MVRLAALFYVIIAPVVMGCLITATLVIEPLYAALGILTPAILGALAAIPLAWIVARAAGGGPTAA